jgi:hypothetical protein
LGFHPVAVVGKLLQNKKRDSCTQKRETIHKTIQKHKVHKVDKHTKQENKRNKNIKNTSRVIRK